MRKLISILPICFFGAQALGQISAERSVIGCLGGSSKIGSTLRVMYTAGEGIISTKSNQSLILTQGFNQGSKEPNVELSVPNAFTPDGDQVNDSWQIPGINEFSENTVVIFNRWGDIIKKFSSYNNQNNYWAGDYSNGQKVMPGTYFYTIEIPQENASLSGWLHIDY